MNIQLKAKIEMAIEKVITDNCEDATWNHYIHPELYSQMTNAAEMVFDASQSAQEFKAQEDV